MVRKIKQLGFHRRTDLDIADIAEMVNPRSRGWINYYGTQYPAEFKNVLREIIDRRLISWARNKLKKLNGSWSQAYTFITDIRTYCPDLFVHWSNE
jgi:RNA-directed DNA polymerase